MTETDPLAHTIHFIKSVRRPPNPPIDTAGTSSGAAWLSVRARKARRPLIDSNSTPLTCMACGHIYADQRPICPKCAKAARENRAARIKAVEKMRAATEKKRKVRHS